MHPFIKKYDIKIRKILTEYYQTMRDQYIEGRYKKTSATQHSSDWIEELSQVYLDDEFAFCPHLKALYTMALELINQGDEASINDDSFDFLNRLYELYVDPVTQYFMQKPILLWPSMIMMDEVSFINVENNDFRTLTCPITRLPLKHVLRDINKSIPIHGALQDLHDALLEELATSNDLELVNDCFNLNLDELFFLKSETIYIHIVHNALRQGSIEILKKCLCINLMPLNRRERDILVNAYDLFITYCLTDINIRLFSKEIFSASFETLKLILSSNPDYLFSNVLLKVLLTSYSSEQFWQLSLTLAPRYLPQQAYHFLLKLIRLTADSQLLVCIIQSINAGDLQFLSRHAWIKSHFSLLNHHRVGKYEYALEQACHLRAHELNHDRQPSAAENAPHSKSGISTYEQPLQPSGLFKLRNRSQQGVQAVEAEYKRLSAV